MSERSHQQRIEALPGLFRQSWSRPHLSPETRCLPVSGATYIFYLDQKAIGVGTSPYVNEVRLLASSVRLGLMIHPTVEGGAVRALAPQVRPSQVLHGR